MTYPRPSLWLDHVCLNAPSLEAADDFLWEALGLALTLTPGLEGEHGRVLLDRTYIDVRTHAADSKPETPLELPAFLLGHADIATAVGLLTAAGIGTTTAPFLAIDGAWQDAVLEERTGVPPVLLTRRSEPPEMAAIWPPPLEEAHLGGILRLTGVQLVSPFVAETVMYLESIVQALAGPQFVPEQIILPPGDYAPADQAWQLRLPDGNRLLVLDPLRDGAARDILLSRGPGVAGIELGTERFTDTQLRLNRAGINYDTAFDDHGAQLRLSPPEAGGILITVRAIEG